MTLDEAIKYYKGFNGTLILVGDESKQIVDWLEELKEYRKGFTEARQKDYETAYAKGFNDGCAKFSVGQDYEDGYNDAMQEMSYNDLNGTTTRFLICPFTRREIVVTPQNHKVFCHECNKYHLLPDGVSRSIEKLKEMNMCEESWSNRFLLLKEI